jgi:putative ABC transport system permease protein
MTPKQKYNSPRVAKLLLKLMSVYHENHSIVEDFEETFSEIRHSHGRLNANFWYWGNTIKSILEYLKLVVMWRFIMLKNYLKIAYRNFLRHKLFSFINIFGLAIGLSICMIISLWVQGELSYDRFHENAHRIYRVERELFRDNLYSRWPIGSGQYKQALMDDFVEIENAVRFWRREYAVKDHKNTIHRQGMFATDNSIFDIFDFGLEEGDEQTALVEPKTVVMTRENAVKFFGTDDVIGRSLSFEWGEESVDFKVTGILQKIPENSHIQFDALISMASYPDAEFANLRSNYLYIYVLISKNITRQALEEKLKTFVSRRLEPVYGDLLAHGLEIHEVLKMHLFPITDIHLHPAENWELEPGGSINSIYIFSTIAVFILLLACINFINLSTARASKRAKEVGLRKTVGAGKNQLRVQFIQESALSALISLVFALVLCSLFIPVFNQIFLVKLSLNLLFQPKNLIFLLGVTFAAGILSGLYPAFFLTRFDPVTVLKGSLQSGKSKSGFRKNMVIFQFVISTILIFGMFTVFQQMKYIQTRSLGFDRENVVVIPARSRQISQSFDSFRSEVLQNTQVVSVSASADLPGDPLYGNGALLRQDSDEPINLIYFTVGYDYVDTLKLEILAGRVFSRDFGMDAERTIILNEAAVKRIGWNPEEAVGKLLERGNEDPPFQVLGVVKDFNFKSLRTEVEPIVIRLSSNEVSSIAVRILPGNMEKTLGFIRQKWESIFPGEQFEYSFLDNRIQELYAKEKRMQNIFIVCSLLSILVACLGLFGLAAYTAEVKTKEIGVRRVLGASSYRVVIMFSKEFVRWVLAANVLAWPVAYYLMHNWLQNFAYRISLEWFVFLASGFLTLFIAAFAFIFQALKAAFANPVDSLRYE